MLPGDQPLEGLEVLIVEDNVEASEMLAMMLTELGADVRVADNYDSALEAVRQRWPFVLISDIGLPGRDGYESMRTVRDLTSTFERPRVLAIALTACSRPQDRERALEAGFDYHLSKPVQPHSLLSAISVLQGGRRDLGRFLKGEASPCQGVARRKCCSFLAACQARAAASLSRVLRGCSGAAGDWSANSADLVPAKA